MSSRRTKQLNSLIKEQLSRIIFQTLDFERSLVTITEVKTSKDVRHCTVKVSVYPLDRAEQVLSRLEDNIYDLQQKLNGKLEMRYVPKISFKIDKTGKKVKEVQEALKEVQSEKEDRQD